LDALFKESGQSSSYSRLAINPSGENDIILFTSPLADSNLQGSPSDPPTVGNNPLFGEDASSEFQTVANAKGVYQSLLAYFATRPDKLFVVITAPPLDESQTDATTAANVRAFNDWLVKEWLIGYPLNNVAVFDLYHVLTSNGGSPGQNDLTQSDGNHHRWWNGFVQHLMTVRQNTSAYSQGEDSMPTKAGFQKATAEFVPLLNIFYDRWKEGEFPPLSITPSATPSPVYPYHVHVPIIYQGPPINPPR
jgi:hypothetical protein